MIETAVVVDLSMKDITIIKGLTTLRQMEEKLEPLLTVHDSLENVIKALVFGDLDGDGVYTIQLDNDHSIVCRMKAGEFEWEQVCTNPEHQSQHQG